MFVDESTVMELLICAGQTRLDAMEAIAAFRQREWGRATDLMAGSKMVCRAVHRIQTTLISQDEGCGKITINLILVHARDHLMTAMLCQDLAKEVTTLRQERSA